MSNIAKIQAAVQETGERGYPAQNILLSKAAAQALVREIAGRGVDVTLGTVCGLTLFVVDNLPDRFGILRYYRPCSAHQMWQYAEPVNVVEFDL